MHITVSIDWVVMGCKAKNIPSLRSQEKAEGEAETEGKVQ